MKKFVLLFSLTFLSVACSLLEPGNDEDYIHNIAAIVGKIKVVQNSNGVVKFKIVLGIPTPCYEFDKRKLTQSGDILYVEYFTKIRKDAVCIQVISSITIEDTFTLEPQKEYLFKFRKSNGTYLDTLMFVK